ncbi:hypothetical protein SAY86_000281 [Trapa natans]|uniref:Lecithin-cholesterol acyltransferase-like 1 n=1 Tax=Trapa natans TaxID=22666 RepID=A0AAN7M3R8_TRANT|nr:hypothetical protein SAY86_000281 [Trapa natans]
MEKRQLLILKALSAAMLCLCACQSSSLILHPIVLVPGAGGNQLEARLNSDYKPSSWLCRRELAAGRFSDGWFRLWFDPSVLLAPFTKCFADRMTLHYDPEKDDYYNAPGVETRVPHFGSTQSLLYLDPHLRHLSAYMEPLVESLRGIGYKDGETLFGAPYDFRYGMAAEGHPSHVGNKFLDDLRRLVETAAGSNGGKRVILLTHSLGGLFALELLRRSPAPWVQTHVRHLLALSAPWGGAVDAMLTLASGNTLGVPLVDPLLVRAEQRSSESNLWLLPNPAVFGMGQTLVVGPDNASYTAGDVQGFLEGIGFPEGILPYKSRIVPLIEGVGTGPGVAVTCIVGSEVRTAERLVYGRERGFDEQPEVVYGDGDGTVNMVSLLAPERLWKDAEGGQEVKVIKLPGVSHAAVLKDRDALERIIGEVSRLNSYGDEAVA